MHLTIFGDDFLAMSISHTWKFPWREFLKIGRNVARESIYNLVKTNSVFIEQFMRYVCFCGDGFF